MSVAIRSADRVFLDWMLRRMADDPACAKLEMTAQLRAYLSLPASEASPSQGAGLEPFDAFLKSQRLTDVATEMVRRGQSIQALVARVQAQEAVLTSARTLLMRDRQSLYESSIAPNGAIEPEDAQALREYDRVLQEIVKVLGPGAENKIQEAPSSPLPPSGQPDLR